MTPIEHSLNLDTRQRDMLAAMGVTYWWPQTIQPPPAQQAQPAQQTPDAAQTVAPPAAAPASWVPEQPAPENTISIADNAYRESARASFDSQHIAPQPGTQAPTHPRPPVYADAHTPPLDTSQLDGAALAHAIEHCQACKLCQGRTRAVVGAGNPRARWLIVGEAPDGDEDRQGQPFMGPAGQLLDAMLAAMGLSREADVYLTNVVKCHPPHNSNPSAAEVAQCRPYLLRQIELVQPDMIVCMGRLAAHALLAGAVPDIDKQPLGKLRLNIHTVAGRPVAVTYHLPYLLRTPAEKGKVWQDLCLAMAHIGHNPLNRPAQTG